MSVQGGVTCLMAILMIAVAVAGPGGIASDDHAPPWKETHRADGGLLVPFGPGDVDWAELGLDGPIELHELSTMDLRLSAAQLKTQDDPPPVLEPEAGIGPGSLIRMTFHDGSGSQCTANFIFTDHDGNLYLGTAGHCLLPGGYNATHSPIADYNPIHDRVEVAVDGCLLMAATFVTYPEQCFESAGPEWVELGEVVYAYLGKYVGSDFGLVRIPPALYPLVRTEMPKWGGPHGDGGLHPGESILMYGHGGGFRSTTETRARVWEGLGSWPYAPNEGIDQGVVPWYSVGGVWFGDSGSGSVVAQVEPDAPPGGHALGITSAGIPPVVHFGTYVSTGLDRMLCFTGLQAWVVPGGSPIDAPRFHCPPECPEECGPPDPPALPEEEDPEPPAPPEAGEPVPTEYLEPSDAIQFVTHKDRVVEVNLVSNESFQVEWLSQQGPSLLLLYPEGDFGANADTCAVMPASWTYSPVRTSANIIPPQAPVNPPGNYTLLIGSGANATVTLWLDAADYLTSESPRSGHAVVTDKSYMPSSVEDITHAGPAPLTAEFTASVSTTGPAAGVLTFESFPFLSAGTAEMTSSLFAPDGGPCAHDHYLAPTFSSILLGTNTRTEVAFQTGQGSHLWQGLFEATAGDWGFQVARAHAMIVTE